MDIFWYAEYKIRQLYRNARKVRITENGEYVPIDDPNREIGKREMIYAVDFDVCGTSKGNKDRPCSIDEKMHKKLKYPMCNTLCCGKHDDKKPNHVKIPAILGWDCNCKSLNGCCKLTCDKCMKNVFRYKCTA